MAEARHMKRRTRFPDEFGSHDRFPRLRQLKMVSEVSFVLLL